MVRVLVRFDGMSVPTCSSVSAGPLSLLRRKLGKESEGAKGPLVTLGVLYAS